MAGRPTRTEEDGAPASGNSQTLLAKSAEITRRPACVHSRTQRAGAPRVIKAWARAPSRPSWGSWRVSIPTSSRTRKRRNDTHGRRRPPCLQTGGDSRRHPSWGRHATHAAAHEAQPDDRAGGRRLHRDGALRAQLDADARALHASDRRAEAGCVGRLHDGHKPVTIAGRLRRCVVRAEGLLGKSGGRREDRTPDLRVANERWERPYLVKRARRKRRKPAD
jgi:hypothetical protein